MCRELRAYVCCTALMGAQGSIWAASLHHIVRTTLPKLMSLKPGWECPPALLLYLCEPHWHVLQTTRSHQVSVHWQSTGSTSSHLLLVSPSNMQKSSWWESRLWCLTPAESSLMPWGIKDLSFGSLSIVKWQEEKEGFWHMASFTAFMMKSLSWNTCWIQDWAGQHSWGVRDHIVVWAWDETQAPSRNSHR